MAVTQLQLYNGALRECGERSLASLAEARPPRYYLDEIWNDGTGAIDKVLEEGLWNFAIRTVAVTYDVGIAPPFGYQRAFAKPTDFIRTSAVCSDEYFNNPLTRYRDEAGYWLADLDTLYIRYVSNDANFGNNWALWSPSFITFFECWLAWKIIKRVTQDKQAHKDAELAMKRARLEARSRDAQAEGAQFMPRGAWVSARMQNSPRLWGDGGRP